jgi:hypothetical protein
LAAVLTAAAGALPAQAPVPPQSVRATREALLRELGEVKDLQSRLRAEVGYPEFRASTLTVRGGLHVLPEKTRTALLLMMRDVSPPAGGNPDWRDVWRRALTPPTGSMPRMPDAPAEPVYPALRTSRGGQVVLGAIAELIDLVPPRDERSMTVSAARQMSIIAVALDGHQSEIEGQLRSLPPDPRGMPAPLNVGAPGGGPQPPGVQIPELPQTLPPPPPPLVRGGDGSIVGVRPDSSVDGQSGGSSGPGATGEGPTSIAERALSEIRAVRRAINQALLGAASDEVRPDAGFREGDGILVWDGFGVFAGGGWKLARPDGIASLRRDLANASQHPYLTSRGLSSVLSAKLAPLSGKMASDLFAPTASGQTAAYQVLRAAYRESMRYLQSLESEQLKNVERLRSLVGR